MLACASCGSVYARTQEFCGLDGTRLAHVDVDPLIGRTVGRYVIASTLGAGGMARVYRGDHEALDSRAAIKVLHGELSADQHLSKRFQREALSLSRIRHENVVQVVDFGKTDAGLLYMVMELVEGRTLAETLRAEGPLAPAVVVRITAEIARGLDAAHQCGYVHRDLKPQNIVLDARSDPPTVKILDFGLVGLVEGEEHDTPLTRAGTFFGTPTYMSPEQSAGERAGPASDMYALGVVLYEMLVGAPPFTGDIRQLAQQHIQAAPKPPSRSFGGLSDLTLALLEKDARHRPTATRLLEQLERWDPSRLEQDDASLPSLDRVTSPAALSVPLEHDEFSIDDRLTQVYEREALGSTRRARALTALFLLLCLGGAGYGLYQWEQRAEPLPLEVKPESPDPALSARQFDALAGRREVPPKKAKKAAAKARRPSSPMRRPAVKSEPDPAPSPAKPEPVAMIIHATFEVWDDDLERYRERSGIRWRALSLAEPGATRQWSRWKQARADVPRDEARQVRRTLEAAVRRLASTDRATLTERLTEAKDAFAGLPSSFSPTRKEGFKRRLDRFETRIAAAHDADAQRAIRRGLDALIRDLREAR